MIKDRNSGYTGIERVERPEDEEVDTDPIPVDVEQAKPEAEPQQEAQQPQQEAQQEPVATDAYAQDYVRKQGSRWFVFSEKGDKLSKAYKSKREADERLRQIEYHKRQGEK